MHFTGNWGGNRDGIKTLPEEYFSFLAANHIAWLGISVAIFNRAMADPTVRIRYRPTNVTTQSSTIYTFDDNDLVSFIDRLRARGIHVYLTLAFEQDPPDSSQCGTNQYWVPRWVFGEPDLTGPSQNDNCLNPAFWWWNPTHLNYTINVATFWKSYTEIAVKYAAMAQQHGVDIFSLGTETDRLFRTRTAGRWPNNFINQLLDMVRQVKAVYAGIVTYDQLYEIQTNTNFFADNNKLFHDLALDVIGVSAYFPLVATPPTGVLSVSELETAWQKVFDSYLMPLQSANPSVPILFLECGYTDVISAPAFPTSNEWTVRTFLDTNGNGIDDGYEQQANIYQAFLNVNRRSNNLVLGAFFWGNGIFTNFPAQTTYINTGVYRKPSEQVIRQAYGQSATSSAVALVYRR